MKTEQDWDRKGKREEESQKNWAKQIKPGNLRKHVLFFEHYTKTNGKGHFVKAESNMNQVPSKNFKELKSS